MNLASRLEGLGKVYGVDLVIGEETAARLDDPALRDRYRCRQGKDPGRWHLHAATRARRAGTVHCPALGPTHGLPATGLGGGIASPR